MVAFFISLVTVMAFDPFEVGGTGAALKQVSGSLK